MKNQNTKYLPQDALSFLVVVWGIEVANTNRLANTKIACVHSKLEG